MTEAHYITLDDVRWRELGALARKYHCDRHLAASAAITALWAAEFPQNPRRRTPERRRPISRLSAPSPVAVSIPREFLPEKDPRR